MIYLIHQKGRGKKKMKATGIVRRIDDLGRVVIPKEIRRRMNIREGEPLEIFIEDKKVIFQKYVPSEENLSEASAEWVKSHAKEIVFVNSINGITTCGFDNGRRESVKHNPSDKFDLNVAICYCAQKADYYVEHLN